MSQPIQQDVNVNVKVTGAEKAVARLNAINDTIKTINKNNIRFSGIKTATRNIKRIGDETRKASKITKEFIKDSKNIGKIKTPSASLGVKGFGSKRAGADIYSDDARKSIQKQAKGIAKEYAKANKEEQKAIQSQAKGVVKQYRDSVRQEQNAVIQQGKALAKYWQKQLKDREKNEKEIRAQGDKLAKEYNRNAQKERQAIERDGKELARAYKSAIKQEQKAIAGQGKELAKSWKEQLKAGRDEVRDLESDIIKKYQKTGLAKIPASLYEKQKNVGYKNPKIKFSEKLNEAGERTRLDAVLPDGSKHIVEATNSFDRLRQSMQQISGVSKKAASSMRGFGLSLDFAGNKSKDAMFNFFRLRAIIAAIASAVFIGGGLLKGWFDLASDYAEANHLFYTTIASSMKDVSDAEKTMELRGEDVFGGMTEEAIKVTPAVYNAANAVKTFANSMALDPTSVKRTYANFYELAVSAGVSSDKIAEMSQGMTQLTYDLASLNDLPFEEVQKRLHSGLSGVTSAVRSLGPDISRTAADAWLLNNGFSVTYNQLTRNNKMIVVYNMLLENTRTAQGDLARSIMQPANMMRILSEQSRIAARALGGAIFPVLTKLIPLFIKLARAIQAAAARLSAFLGKHLGSWYTEAAKGWNSFMGGLEHDDFGSGMFDDMNDDIDDSASGLDNVGGSAKKAKKALEEIRDFQLGFDELHVLPDEPSGSGGGGGGGGGGGLGAGMADLDIPLDDLYDIEGDAWELLEQDANETLTNIKNWIDDTFGPGTVEAFGQTAHEMFETLRSNAIALKTAVDELFSSLGEYWDWVDFLKGVATGFDLMSDGITNLLTTIIGMFPKAIKFLTELPLVGPLFRILFENIDQGTGIIVGMAIALRPFSMLFKTLGLLLKPIIKLVKGLGRVFRPLLELFKKGKVLVVQFVEKLGGLPGIFEKLKGMFSKLTGGGSAGKLLGRSALKATPGVGEIMMIIESIQSIGELVPQAFEDLKAVLTAEDPLQAWLDYLSETWSSGAFVSNILNLMGLDELIPAWEELWTNIQNGTVFADFTVWLSEKFTEIKETALGIWNNFTEGLFTWWDNTWQKIINNPVVQFVVSVVKGIKDKISTTWDNLTTALSTWWNNTWYKIKNNPFVQMIDGIIHGKKNAISNAWNTLTDNLSTWWHNTWSRISNNPLINGVVNFVTGAADKIKSVWSSVVDVIDNVRAALSVDFPRPNFKLPHFSWSSRRIGSFTFPVFGGISWYKKGGIFDEASTIGVGEAGPEAVVPLSGQRMSPFAKAISDEMASSNNECSIDSDLLAQKISTAVYNAMLKGFPKDIKTDVYLDATKVNDELHRNNKLRGVGTSIIV